MNIMRLFFTIIVVQLFFSFAVTIFCNYLPDEAKNRVSSFSDLANDIDLTEVSGEVQGALERQTNIPVIEIGALVFYSGNILLDLLLNFAFAIPEMIGLVVYGIQSLLQLPSYIIVMTELFSGVVVIALYFMSLIQLITGLRSGRLT